MCDLKAWDTASLLGTAFINSAFGVSDKGGLCQNTKRATTVRLMFLFP